jgi:hypothetical protein
MDNEAKALAVGDKVYVTRWGVRGEVVAPRPGEPLEAGSYCVAARGCFTRDELEFDATEAEIEKRQLRIIQKTAVVRGIHQTVQNVIASKVTPDIQLIIKYAEALDDLRSELGEEPLFGDAGSAASAD